MTMSCIDNLETTRRPMSGCRAILCVSVVPRPRNKTPVTGARELGGEIKARPIEHAYAAKLVGLVGESVSAGATIYNDDAADNAALPSIINQFQQEPVSPTQLTHRCAEYPRHRGQTLSGKREDVRGEVHTNSIKIAGAVLTGTIHGTWHHISPKHLGRYFNEAAFRLNEGHFEVNNVDDMTEFARGVSAERLSHGNLDTTDGLSGREDRVR